MKRFDPRAWPVMVALVLLAACASLGVPEPRDFYDRASLAYDITGGGAALVADLNQAGQLDTAEANDALDALDGYKHAIDLAVAAWAVNQADGEARLATIRAELNEMVADLQARRAGDDD